MSPRCVLAVASTGGHLDELHTFVPRFAADGQPVVWVTAATAQSKSLLHGQEVEWVPHVGARQGGRTLLAVPQAMRIMKKHRPEMVLSTGAALSVSYLVAARLQRIETHFVESATRLDGPSITGRIAEALPGVRLYRQVDNWQHTGGDWRSINNVFDTFERQSRPAPQSLKIVVILGTERFPFTRAVNAVAAALPRDVDVTWQLGHTPQPSGLPGDVRAWFHFDELQHAVREADVVVTHCGVGSVLMALRNQKCPVVIPRIANHNEHVDDHQCQLARVLNDASLGIVADLDERNFAELLARAAECRIVWKVDQNATRNPEGD